MAVIIIITRVNTNKLRKLDFSRQFHATVWISQIFTKNKPIFFKQTTRKFSGQLWLSTFQLPVPTVRRINATRHFLSVHLIQISICNFEFWGIALTRMKIGILVDECARGIMYKETLKKMRLNVGMLRW